MITKEVLSELVWSKPLAQVAQELGVSRGSVTSMCNTHGIAQTQAKLLGEAPGRKKSADAD
ncbi:hypothetical protein AB7M56_006968 [Bradyrhizobium elkanii]|nr:hypothetical protein [Bradyrhizobium elkanii]MCS3520143.1 hypothetical protein [Bradyrhizobium elkanii]MCS4067798.1 hypothetical protein [Bradyrhizobium elkanii]MCS4083334.1 hypothetical protein [Bradyrhizobium elkanii]MCS4105546.1 hypothetical protein [Bradyrhizobium elkanii]